MENIFSYWGYRMQKLYLPLIILSFLGPFSGHSLLAWIADIFKVLPLQSKVWEIPKQSQILSNEEKKESFLNIMKHDWTYVSSYTLHFFLFILYKQVQEADKPTCSLP